MPIHNIFPIPIYIENDQNILIKEDKKLLQEIFYKEGTILFGSKNSGSEHKISKNNYILDVDGLGQIKQKMLNHVKKYIEETLSPKLSGTIDGPNTPEGEPPPVSVPYEREIEFYITQSWINVHESGTMHPPHQHSNSLVSGIFYIKVLEQDSINFEHLDNHISQRFRIMSPAFDFEPCNRTKWNATQIEFKPQTNDIFIFPSWLTHYVNKVERTTKQPEERISLSFNTFIKGTLGQPHGLNELKLN